jgi:DNA polymerase-3 subunit delta'
MPYKYLKKSILKTESILDINKLDLKDIYNFLKDNQKISKNEAKDIVESILIKANNQKLKLSRKQLELFSMSIKLLELNSRPINILTTLLLSIANQKNKH